jgi:hypothetical protein
MPVNRHDRANTASICTHTQRAAKLAYNTRYASTLPTEIIRGPSDHGQPPFWGRFPGGVCRSGLQVTWPTFCKLEVLRLGSRWNHLVVCESQSWTPSSVQVGVSDERPIPREDRNAKKAGPRFLNSELLLGPLSSVVFIARKGGPNGQFRGARGMDSQTPRERGMDDHVRAAATGEARDMEPQGPGVRAAGGPAELQGI